MLNLRVSGLKNIQTKQNKTLMLQRKKILIQKDSRKPPYYFENW